MSLALIGHTCLTQGSGEPADHTVQRGLARLASLSGPDELSDAADNSVAVSWKTLKSIQARLDLHLLFPDTGPIRPAGWHPFFGAMGPLSDQFDPMNIPGFIWWNFEFNSRVMDVPMIKMTSTMIIEVILHHFDRMAPNAHCIHIRSMDGRKEYFIVYDTDSSGMLLEPTVSVSIPIATIERRATLQQDVERIKELQSELRLLKSKFDEQNRTRWDALSAELDDLERRCFGHGIKESLYKLQRSYMQEIQEAENRDNSINR